MMMIDAHEREMKRPFRIRREVAAERKGDRASRSYRRPTSFSPDGNVFKSKRDMGFSQRKHLIKCQASIPVKNGMEWNRIE